ncbi:hypothetical protein DIPPA_34086 [Diplonema papillatum]|nr:hypothetical protein DIPPA_34086 [Diplonema papillatum]
MVRRLVVLDYCGTLCPSVCRFDVGYWLKRSGLSTLGFTEKSYWKFVSDTWEDAAVAGTPFQALLRAEAAGGAKAAAGADVDAAVSSFVEAYWNAHIVHPLWFEAGALPPAARVLLAVSAVLRAPKKSPAFWETLLYHEALQTNAIVVATDHYSDACEPLARHLGSDRTEVLSRVHRTPARADQFPYDEVVVVDDFGAAERPAACYPERSAETERVLRSVLPAGVTLRIVRFTPGNLDNVGGAIEEAMAQLNPHNGCSG